MPNLVTAVVKDHAEHEADNDRLTQVTPILAGTPSKPTKSAMKMVAEYNGNIIASSWACFSIGYSFFTGTIFAGSLGVIGALTDVRPWCKVVRHRPSEPRNGRTEADGGDIGDRNTQTDLMEGRTGRSTVGLTKDGQARPLNMLGRTSEKR